MRRSFERWRSDVDIAVIEAMGGPFDGIDGTGRGSPVEPAKLLGVPVVDSRHLDIVTVPAPAGERDAAVS